jgi:3-hydroxyacyl-[acyl-carrier-protein] dehydratase
MIGFERAETGIVSRFVFPETFVGFQGHFPDKKVLPGVCQVQCALSTAERANQKKLRLKEIVLAKYFAPVGPGEEILCTCSDIADTPEFTFKAAISKGTIKVSELKLRVAGIM